MLKTAAPLLRATKAVSARFSRQNHHPTAHGGVAELKSRLAAQIPAFSDKVKKIRKEHGNKVLGSATIDQAYGGMRDIKSMVYETSLLDSQEGIRFRGLSIPECQARLPTWKEGGEPLPEAMFWLLLTGEVPTRDQCLRLAADLHARSDLPAHAERMIKNLPKTMHPMTQLSTAILALQTESKFAQAYADGIPKSQYWEYAFEDTIDILAKLPNVAAIIYRHKYKDNKIPAYRDDLDWAGNFANMLGFHSEQFADLMRLYMSIHIDHEGGNVSAHTTHLVGSALSDPYLSLSAGMCGLAGPLHGLANQEVLKFLKELKINLGDRETNKENLTEAVWDILKSGQVIPGYGHAVLRKTDPRYTCQREFALKHLPNDELFKLVSTLYEVVPGVLTQHGKTKNPWPNVDAHSGVLLQHYGLVEEDYYTVLFGLSRSMGVLANLVWARALGLPIERPKSVTTEWVEAFIKGTAAEE